MGRLRRRGPPRRAGRRGRDARAALKDEVEGLAAFHSRALLRAHGSDDPERSATATTFVFDHARLAAAALAYATDVVGRATDRVERRPDLEPLPGSANAASLAFTVLAEDGRTPAPP